MITPDFRDFKPELYHYGMPRRSGRYPWGSGKRPYQGDMVKSIDDAVKKNKKILKTREKIFASAKIRDNMDYASSDLQNSIDRLSKKANALDDQREHIRIVSLKEINEAFKNPDFKKEVDEYIYEHTKGTKRLDKDNYDYTLRDGIYNIVNNPKYTPESYKKQLQLNKNIDEYHDSVNKEIANFIDKDIGSTRISKARSGITYYEVARDLLDDGISWVDEIALDKQKSIDYILSRTPSFYPLEEYNQKHANGRR